MMQATEQSQTSWWKFPSRQWNTLLNEREGQVFLVLTLLIGALVGLMAVAFILLTDNQRHFPMPELQCGPAGESPRRS